MEQPAAGRATEGQLRHPPPAPRARDGARPGRGRRKVLAVLVACVAVVALCSAPFIVVRLRTPPAYSDKPLQVPGLRGVTAVAAGDRFSLALRDDGTVWAWGRATYGQLGFGPRDQCETRFPKNCQRRPRQVPLPRRAVAIAAGPDNGLAITDDGAVWVWGSDRFGGLGDSAGDTSTYRPGLKSSETLTYREVPAQLPAPRDATALAVGGDFFLALAATGELWSWSAGRRVPARLAVPGPVALIAAGGRRSAMVLADGSVWYGQGVPPPDQQTTLRGATALAMDDDTVVAALADGTIWFRGYGYGAETCIVRYDLPAIPCGNTPQRLDGLPSATALALRTGFDDVAGKGNLGRQWDSGPVGVGAAPVLGKYRDGAFMALAPDGTLWFWDNGRMAGRGVATARPYPLDRVRAVAAAADHYLALRTDGTVWAWGDNTYGQLGR